jgi:hypothetical protein
MDLAKERVRELLVFFGGSTDKKPPPVWNDVVGQKSAERQRNAMHERSRPRDVGDFVIDTPMWRVSEDSVALDAGYHLLRGRTISESGRFSLGMIWREKMWLVTHVELNPTQ